MLIKRMAIASGAALGLLSLCYGASAGPATGNQAVFAARQASAGSNTAVILVEDGKAGDREHYRRSRYAKHRYSEYHEYRNGRPNAGPPYDDCYMKCIFSSHPADFCADVSQKHFCY